MFQLRWHIILSLKHKQIIPRSLNKQMDGDPITYSRVAQKETGPFVISSDKKWEWNCKINHVHQLCQ